jgi:phosphatidylglycerol:prolipoprotein diacylglycerol transferase
MMKFPEIDPVLVHIGPLQVRWYGLMYIIGFVLAYFVVVKISQRRKYDMTKPEIEDLLAYCVIGLIVGARLGYCLFYNLWFYLDNPFKVFAVWEGGMSFHGGLIGLILAGWVYSRLKHKSFLMLADLGAIASTPGLFFGRMGNFINAELYGRVTDMPWGMIFPHAGDLPRHPSQIYEAVFEGIIMFVILYFIHLKSRMQGILIASFLFLYGLFRFFLEFYREPDSQMGFILGLFTMGQVLCIIMMFAGTVLLVCRLKSFRA